MGVIHMLKKYLEERLNNGISEKTVNLEETYISLFHAFINSQYKRYVEYHEIRPLDVRNFLDHESEKNSDHTIMRKITILNNWFDFLWREKKIPIDYMTKFKYHRKLVRTPLREDIEYEVLLEKKSFILNSDASLTSKVVFILLMRGLRAIEIQNLVLDNLIENNQEIVLYVNQDTDKEFKVLFSDPQEVHLLLEAHNQAIFRGVTTLLSTKKLGETHYSAFAINSLQSMLTSLEKRVGLPIKSESIRKSYMVYLVKVKKYSIEQLATKFGLRPETAATLKKTILESTDNNSYNREQAL